MRASLFSLVGLLAILVALWVGMKYGSQIPLLNKLG